MNKLSFAVAIACLLAFNACTSGRSVDDAESHGSTSDSSSSGTTDGNGNVNLSFEIRGDATSFAISLFVAEGTATIRSLVNPGGQSILNGSTIPTSVAGSSPFTVSYPYLSGIVVGGTYQASFQVTSDNDPVAGASVSLQVISKSDSDPEHGTLRVNLIKIGPVADSNESDDALEKALDVYKIIMSRAGISIDPLWYEFDGPSIVPDPRSSSSFYENLAAQTREEAVNIVFASEVDNVGGRTDRFGVTGAAPGPGVPSGKSAIALSIIRIAGRDGKFNYGEELSDEVHDDEVRLAAEEMSRLSSSYLGLENIVELGTGNRVTSTDSLSDTPSCVTYTECRLEREVRNNVMFPIPVQKEGQDEEYFSRDYFTDQQRLVVNNSVLVD